MKLKLYAKAKLDKVFESTCKNPKFHCLLLFVHVKINKLAYFRINIKTRYNLEKTIRKLWITLEHQLCKFIKDLPTTNHIMHFLIKNHEGTRQGQNSHRFNKSL